MLQQTMRSVCSVLSKEGGAQHTRLPITPELLLKLRKVWQKDAGRFDIDMLWTACTTCFYEFFRAGEITTPLTRTFSLSNHLVFIDVAVDCVDNSTVLHIWLKHSKTDPFCQGIDVFMGHTYNALWPVVAMIAYLAVWGGGAGSLFQFQDGWQLTRECFVEHVREGLSQAGMDAHNGKCITLEGKWLEDLYPEPSQLKPGQEWVENWKAIVVNEDNMKKQKLRVSTSNKRPPERKLAPRKRKVVSTGKCFKSKYVHICCIGRTCNSTEVQQPGTSICS